MSKRVYWLWLTTRDDLGAETIRKLTTSFGTPGIFVRCDTRAAHADRTQAPSDQCAV